MNERNIFETLGQVSSSEAGDIFRNFLRGSYRPFEGWGCVKCRLAKMNALNLPEVNLTLRFLNPVVSNQESSVKIEIHS